MDFHVLTPAGAALVMRTEEGQVVLVLPAPPESLPAAPDQPESNSTSSTVGI